MRQLTTTFVPLLRRFLRARGGIIAVIFALTTIPVVGLVGAAVDYSRANSAKAAMQAAVDATALILSKDAATLTSAQMNQKAIDYFYAMFNRTEVTNIAITPVYSTTDATQLVLTGTGKVPTTLTKILGFQQLNIGVSSTIRWGNNRLRVALVLDNTGSMASSNKMTALKTAAKNLLTQLKNAATQNGDVYVSIIPFAKDVNADKTNVSQAWLRWDLWDPANSNSNNSTTFSGSICYLGTLWQVSGSTWTNGGSCTTPAPGICYQGTLWNWNGTTFVNGGNLKSSTNNTPPGDGAGDPPHHEHHTQKTPTGGGPP